MRYIVDIPRWLDTKIKVLFAKDASDYAGMDEFIIVACENQLKLEKTSLEDLLSETTRYPESQSLLKESFEDILEQSSVAPTVKAPSSDKIEAILLWGQINRIFPVKLGVRVLVNMIKENGGDYIDLETFRKKASNVARDFGKKLIFFDKQNERKTGRKFSTGLPTGKKVELSKKRYRSHYLAYQTGRGTLVGALAELRLVNIQNGTIGITKTGLDFARLENPLLDSNEVNSLDILSEAEIELYLSLVGQYLPKEEEFMKTILRMIESGEPARDRFNINVKKFLTIVWDGDVTMGVANTMRSGVLSRMWELGLVDNEKVGRRVVYSINDIGRQYLKGDR